jgi:hypothetical protein
MQSQPISQSREAPPRLVAPSWFSVADGGRSATKRLFFERAGERVQRDVLYTLDPQSPTAAQVAWNSASQLILVWTDRG